MLKSSPCFVKVTNLAMQADFLYMLSVSWCEAQGSLLCSFMAVWASLVAQMVKNLPAMQEKVKVLLTQSCLTLCDPMDCSPPGSSVPGILQARILEWVAMLFSRDLPDLELNPHLLCILHWQVAGRFFTTSAT